ncbi:MAG: TetR/AcrR family transcriptional regulator [Acidimicrobiia bacterium]
MSSQVPRTGRRAPGEDIVAAARRLLDEAGENFTIQQLVDEAGIALQTFYRYFPGKDQLMLAVLGEMVAEACAAMALGAAAYTDPIERLEFLVTAPLRGLNRAGVPRGRLITREHFRLLQIFPDGVRAATKPFSDLVVAVLEDAQRQSKLTPIDIERDAWAINRLVMTTYHQEAFSDLDGLDEVNDHLWRFCAAAVGHRV